MADDIPMLSKAAVVKLAAITVHVDSLIADIYMGDQTAQLNGMRVLRELISDHEIMALRLALDRQNLLPPRR